MGGILDWTSVNGFRLVRFGFGTSLDHRTNQINKFNDQNNLIRIMLKYTRMATEHIIFSMAIVRASISAAIGT
jgi:hypothetical protein